MTRPIQALILVAALASGALAVEGLATIGPAVAQAVSEPDAGAAPTPTVTTSTTETPAGTVTVTETVIPPTVDNPITDPGAAFDDIRAAKKIGWPALVIVALTALLLGLKTVVPSLAKGSTAFLLACGTAGLLAAGNTVLAKGSWVSVATAAGVACWGMWNANREQAARDKAAKAAGTIGP